MYNYDRGGNILSKVKYAYTTGTLGATLQTIPYSYGDSNWKDKLTSYNGQEITYDAIGNPLNDGIWSYTWGAGRQLRQMSKTGTTIQFKYDHNGLRTQKIVTENGVTTTTNYTLHGKLITHMSCGNDNLHFFYDAQSRPVKVQQNATMYTYLHNLQGDIVGLLDNSGTLVVEYKYDAWGKLLNTTGALFDTLGRRDPFRYRGYIYDEESGLHYLRSRYYSSDLARFIGSDSLVGEVGELLLHNAFSYCMNSPVQCLDADGCWPSWATKLIVGAAAIVVGAVVVAATAGTAAFIPAAVAGLKCAAVAGAASAATNVVAEAVTTIQEGGTLKDFAEDAVVAARDGFADGFMVGGITAGVSMAASAPLLHSDGIKIGNTSNPKSRGWKWAKEIRVSRAIQLSM